MNASEFKFISVAGLGYIEDDLAEGHQSGEKDEDEHGGFELLLRDAFEDLFADPCSENADQQ